MVKTSTLAVVQRHEFGTFGMLARAFADEPGVRLLWDRRTRERRLTPSVLTTRERRRRQRRCAQQKSWAQNNFVLVSLTEDARTVSSEASAASDRRTRAVRRGAAGY
jgi:hypothetical protein